MNTFSSVPTGANGTRAEVTRSLSPTERWYWIADQLSTLNAVARVRVDGDLSFPALREALGVLQARHPLLRLAIEAEPSGVNPRFQPTDAPIPLREVVLSSSEDTRWVREMDSHELAEPIDWRSGPLARAVVVSQPGRVHDLIITVAHCVADGTTVLALLRQWVRLALDPSAADRTAASRPVLPPVEALFPERHRGGSGAMPDRGPAGGEADPGTARRVEGRLEADRFVPFHSRRTRLVHRSLPSEDLENLALACKREDVTMHGVLAAAMVCAVAREAGGQVPEYLTIGSPVDLRGELVPAVDEDEVGAYVSAIPSSVRYRPDDLWAMAGDVNRDIAERRRRGEQFASAGLLEQGPSGVADSEPFVRYMEEYGPFNYFISNIGRFDFPDTVGACRLSGAQLVGGISVVGHFGAAVSTSHGELFWNFTHIADAVSRARAERLADDSVAIVRAAVRASEGRGATGFR